MSLNEGIWQFSLYVAGSTTKSIAATNNLKKFCEELLPGKYKIKIIDLVKHPQLAEADQILAIPTLVKSNPQPVRKIIGDLSNEQKVLAALGLPGTKVKI